MPQRKDYSFYAAVHPLVGFAQSLLSKQWKKEQASRCCRADVCRRQSVNQLYNKQTNSQTCSFFHCLLFLSLRLEAPCGGMPSLHWRTKHARKSHKSSRRLFISVGGGGPPFHFSRGRGQVLGSRRHSSGRITCADYQTLHAGSIEEIFMSAYL